MKIFKKEELKSLYSPKSNSNGEDNGQITIIGGSHLFHGAPVLSLRASSRVVDMVFFTSPEKGMMDVANYIKSELSSFIWVPYEEVEKYIEKSDAVLIGPGMMRYKSENSTHHAREHICDEACRLTRDNARALLEKYPTKKWVIDAGSLQTMDATWIPKGAILTPNLKEFCMLFKKCSYEELKAMNNEERETLVSATAKEFSCVIALKGIETIVSNGTESVLIKGGNAGLTKGGTGDVQAGLTVGLLAKNDPFLAATSAAFIVKSTADELYKGRDTYYNAEDLADFIPQKMASLLN